MHASQFHFLLKQKHRSLGSTYIWIVLSYDEGNLADSLLVLFNLLSLGTSLTPYRLLNYLRLFLVALNQALKLDLALDEIL